MFQITDFRPLFVEAFVAAWTDFFTRVRAESIAQCYSYSGETKQSKHPWTRCMVDGGSPLVDWPVERGVLQSALIRYGAARGYGNASERIRPGESGLDLLLAGGELAARRGTAEFSWPARIAAIVEHERGTDIHTEIWKLMFWRADLKVLVCYDEGRGSAHMLSKTFAQRFDECRRMVESARHEDPDGFRPEQLLVIVGRYKSGVGLVSWTQRALDSEQEYLIWAAP